MSDNSSAWDRVDAKYFPTAPRRLTGSAQFTTDKLNSATFTIEDFWSWAYSDLKTNASRAGKFTSADDTSFPLFWKFMCSKRACISF